MHSFVQWSHFMFFNSMISVGVWTSIVSVPLIFSYFPVPGFVTGICAVLVGQVTVLTYFWLGFYGERIQTPPPYVFSEALVAHILQPEGLLLVGGYLAITWAFEWMPPTYYVFSGIDWFHVALQLLCQDAFQYGIHLLQHKWMYSFHKHHHRFIHPKLFDAFHGSVSDTCFMILVPLIITARLVPANGWSYMTFGTLYASSLTLIHSEFAHPWDPLFTAIGFGTPADHHTHHTLYRYNYGHLFMYWDRLFGTYKKLI